MKSDKDSFSKQILNILIPFRFMSVFESTVQSMDRVSLRELHRSTHLTTVTLKPVQLCLTPGLLSTRSKVIKYKYVKNQTKS